MERKILFIASISKHILRFHLPYLRWFQENGFETHVAASGEETISFCDVKHTLPISRRPISISNYYSHRILRRIIEKNNYTLIHGHTPVGGFLTRTASATARKKGTKVLYTAHGFHFYKGAPLMNWAIYFPIEKLLAKYTDAIITINKEDYQILKSRNFKSSGKYLVNGVGVDNERFHPISYSEKIQLRSEHGFFEDQIILVFVAEFIHRKNHKFIIDAIKGIALRYPKIKVLFAGRGRLLETMRTYVDSLGISDVIEFMGFRADIAKILAISDIGISASKQEGLPINIAEEMMVGLPIVATQERGHRELVIHGINGYLFEQNNKKQFVDYICTLAGDEGLRTHFGRRSSELAQKFSLPSTLKSMGEIYKTYMG